jgi:hypothetical protein
MRECRRLDGLYYTPNGVHGSLEGYRPHASLLECFLNVVAMERFNAKFISTMSQSMSRKRYLLRCCATRGRKNERAIVKRKKKISAGIIVGAVMLSVRLCRDDGQESTRERWTMRWDNIWHSLRRMGGCTSTFQKVRGGHAAR